MTWDLLPNINVLCADTRIVRRIRRNRLKDIAVSVVQIMGKQILYTCDICGKEIKGHSAQAVAGVSAQIKLWTPGDYRAGPGQRIDLCEDCFVKFVAFLEGGERE